MKYLEGIPRILFKYRDWANEHHRRIIYNQELYFPSMSQFNDPYEGTIPFRYEDKDLTPDKIFIKMLYMAKKEFPDWPDDKLHSYVYENQKKDLLHDEVHKKKVQKQVIEDIEKSYGIFSLTKEENNFLMWSHYSNSHTGFCVGFDSHVLSDLIKGGIGPVTYQISLPRFSFFENTMKFSQKLLSTKSDIWNYENEFRIIKSNLARKVIVIPPDGIVRLIFGCKMDLNTKIRLIAFVEKNLKLCEVFESTLNKDEFRIDLMRIY